MAMRQQVMKFCVAWHKRLAWVGGLALIVWGVSGISHPVMSWTGPKANAFFAPPVMLNSETIKKLPEATHGLTGLNVSVAKIVASAQGPLLQFTEHQNAERRYFDLSTGEWLTGQDEAQAAWLASYYTGRPSEDIASIEFLNNFTGDYPSVNRLLPVYKVTFNGDDALQAYVHTETAALASLNDATKRNVQFVFRQLHTWEFLDFAGFGRALLLALLLLSLFLMCCAGIGLLVVLKERKIQNRKRRWHRSIAYVIWLPLMAWSFSGFYHLFQGELVDRVSGMHLDKPFIVSDLANSNNVDWLASYKDKQIRSVSIVRAPTTDGLPRSLVRLGLAAKTQDHHANGHGNKYDNKKHSNKKPSGAHDHGDTKVPSRAARFAGIPSEQSSAYIDLRTGAVIALSDKERATELALDFTEMDISYVASTELITHFGNGYDFRNKRLPVWRVAFNDDAKRHVFIDPTTGVLVDQNRAIDRRESWFFSVLHKWNPLAFIGRQNRDYVMVATLGIAIGFSVVGLLMLRKRRG